MPPNASYTKFSPSGKVTYAVTNWIALIEKESVHEDFHPLMDFLKICPISYALTASPPIYTEIVQEMWSTADCRSTRGGIKFTIKGNSYIITPSVINEALHFPESNFKNSPTHGEIVSMLKAINYAGNPRSLSQIHTKKFRKEWLYFFDTLNKCFAGKCSSYGTINAFVLKIAYSLLYGRRIDIGKLLLDELSNKFGAVQERDHVIYFARFLMIIANYLCKDICVEDINDTLQVHMQTQELLARLVTKNLNSEVQFVLPEHVKVQLTTLYSALSHTSYLLLPPRLEDMRKGYSSPTQVALAALPAPHQSGTVASVPQSSGKRKRSNIPCVNGDENKESETAHEVHLPQKKKDASNVSSLSVVDHDMPPAETRDGVPPVQLPSSLEEENPVRDVLVPTQDPDDRQHLLNAASVLKSQLVVRLTSYADSLSAEDMILLAKKCYNTLEGLGVNYTFFSTEVNKLIAQYQELALAAKNKDDWNEWDMKARYIHKVQSLSEVRKKLSCAEEKLSEAKAHADFIRVKKEELTGASLKLIEELHQVEERVKTLTAERDQCKEAHSVAEAEQYNAANKEFEKIKNYLLQLVRK